MEISITLNNRLVLNKEIENKKLIKKSIVTVAAGCAIMVSIKTMSSTPIVTNEIPNMTFREIKEAFANLTPSEVAQLQRDFYRNIFSNFKLLPF